MIKPFTRSVGHWLSTLGVDPSVAVKSVRGFPRFVADYLELRRQQRTSERRFDFTPSYPCLGDRFAAGGVARGHYFHQDLLVAQRIFEHGPRMHVDVGSRVDGFVAHVAAFRPIRVLDIRPLVSTARNVSFARADLMADLDPTLIASCDSLSCLHALEHFGLGRYGDPVDYDGHLKGLRNLTNLLEPGGRLYLSTPIGPQRIEFNAHRVFDVAYLLELVDPDFRVDMFSYVDDAGELHENVPLDPDGVTSSFGCLYGCGIFELVKRDSPNR